MSYRIMTILNFICFALAANIFSKISGGYSGDNDSPNIISPGDCQKLLPNDFPRTFQCAKTGVCLPLSSYRNGVNECCGKTNTGKCDDLSDESGVDPVAADCNDHPSSASCLDPDTWYCKQYVKKNTPHCNCTSSTRCLTYDSFMNGKKDCIGGEDEDPKKNPPCSPSEAASCNPNYKSCIKICGNPDCRY